MSAELEAAPSFAQAHQPGTASETSGVGAMFDSKLGMSSVITYMVIMRAHSALSLALHPTTQCSVCTASAHSFYPPVLLP